MPNFKYGDKVALVTDRDNSMHVITGILTRGYGQKQYEVMCNNMVSYHYPCMLTKWKRTGGKAPSMIPQFEE